MFQKVGYQYEQALAAAYHRIDDRGILVDVAALDLLRKEVESEIANVCGTLSSNWGILVYVGKIQPSFNSGNVSTLWQRSVNINANSGDSSILNTLKSLGYKVPAVRKKNKDKEWEMKESADELALQKMFAETGDINLKHLMRVKELTKLLGTYINARLYRDTFYSTYGVASTVTGRRGCSKHVFGFGGNAQTFPSHTSDRFTHDYRKCLVARPGTIFFSVDQKSAEDWPVSALAGNYQALKELGAITWPESDRHTRLAAFVFGIPVSQYTRKEWKDDSHPAGTMRYIGGKKARHANNYRMKAQRMSEELAKLGFSFTKQACEGILAKVNQADPLIQTVFHKYVETCINTDRTLRTPLGRERQFFNFRPGSPNNEALNEACAYIPQSTVGDNTGLAVLYLDSIAKIPYVINEAHDSIKQEVPDNLSELERVFIQTDKAFDRTLRFYNGIEVKIPIEAELGYDFENKVSLKDYTIEALREAYYEIQQKYKKAPERECLVNTVIG